MDIEKIKSQALEDIEKVSDETSLEQFRVQYLGRKNGEITSILKSLKDLPTVEKAKKGFIANELKKEILVLIERKKESFANKKDNRKFDVTRPHKKISHGELHPLTKIEREIRNIFMSLGFSSINGPEVETEFNNFDALNLPKNHPAREMWDTLWLEGREPSSENKNDKDGGLLLRTHTSPMQIRYMMDNKPPFQIIVPGRVFRNEATDSSHEINFYQIEGLMVGENVSLANFMYIMESFFKELFKRKKVQIRYRPSYFPFVEPGLEIDIKFGNGNWLEIAGAGMVHPNVFRTVGYDSKKVSGFAFGFGLDRLAMIKYGIKDIRLFYNGDLRFIKQPFK